MLKTENTEKENITELQKYLYEISCPDSPDCAVIPDGRYGPETAAAVRMIQQKYNIPETGETDRKTWETISSVHKHTVRNIPYPVSVFPAEQSCISEGSTCPAVFFLQTMLMMLHRTYSSLPEVEITGIYDRQTTDAVRHMQMLSLYPQTGSADKYTWNNIVRIFEHTAEKRYSK